MRLSQFFVATLKEAPSEAEIVSHRLMLRAGLIRRLASGMYSWLPLGLRVLRKVEAVVRDEMVKAGAIEVLMPAVQPAELWIESQRWQKYGPELLRFKDRHEREFCFGPTHEEVITDLVRREVKSYRQLPLNFFQIQTKFRDEIRPRFGVMRGREFLMKDAYSFHTSYESLVATYNTMHDAYSRVFGRLGLRFRAVAADTGSIGGDGSHEFHVLADSGEDDIAFCPNSDYAANVELAEALAPATPRPAASKTMEKIATPNRKTIAEVAEFLGVPPQTTVKALLLKGVDGPVMLLLRGDHELNEIKAGKLAEIGGDCVFADDATLTASLGCPAGYIGPVGAKLPVIADRAVAAMADFVCGANEAGHHWVGVNFGRDLPEPKVADIRNVVPGDASPDGKGTLEICRGIEVGHIFQLRKRYSSEMNCCFLDENHQTVAMEMGCYGIGVSRIVGACIEQNHDERGICFPRAMAPFELALIPIGYHRNAAVRAAVDQLYSDFQAAGVDVVMDDRDERPGVMFADQELMGIPHRLVVGDRGLAKNEVEYQGRRDAQSTALALQNIVSEIKSRL